MNIMWHVRSNKFIKRKMKRLFCHSLCLMWFLTLILALNKFWTNAERNEQKCTKKNSLLKRLLIIFRVKTERVLVLQLLLPYAVFWSVLPSDFLYNSFYFLFFFSSILFKNIYYSGRTNIVLRGTTYATIYTRMHVPKIYTVKTEILQLVFSL